MKEVLYSIPVNDIFSKVCECPICEMRRKLEQDVVEFAMGPSYMEDDIRLTTDKLGFCERHMQQLYDFENRLGLALIMNTHMQTIIKEIEARQKKGRKSAGSLFSKSEGSAIGKYTKTLHNTCYVCDRIGNTFERYVATTFYLYENDEAFRTKFKKCRGFCTDHYGLLYELAPKYLSSKEVPEFTKLLDSLFLENFKRMQEEVSWFIDKFDYRNKDADWKTSKDAVPRAMNKLNGITPKEKKVN